MKILFKILALLFIALSLSNPVFAQSAYTIKANIPGSADGFVYLTHAENDKHPADSTAIANQQFELKGTVGAPEYDDAHKSGNKKMEDSVLARFNAINAQKWELLKTSLAKNPESYAATFYAANLVRHVEEAGELYNVLSADVKTSYSAVRIKALIDAAQQTAIGSEAPNFILKDVNGKPVSLASFKGKFVLIDFWASWCQPCRVESPYLLAAYEKNKPNGFVILSVSIDEDTKSWRNAIKQDNMQWPQMIDEREWKSNIVKQYAVTDLPFNFLLDRGGKIIAKNLRGEDVADKIASLMK